MQRFIKSIIALVVFPCLIHSQRYEEEINYDYNYYEGGDDYGYDGYEQTPLVKPK